MATHLIRFKEKYYVEWDGSWNEKVFGKLTLRFHAGDVVSCDVGPDGPGHTNFDYPCCEVNIFGIDLWNVPDSVFEVLVGELPENMRKHK